MGWFDTEDLGWSQSLIYVPELLDVYNTARPSTTPTRNNVLPPSFGGETVTRSVSHSAAQILLGLGIGVTLFDRALAAFLEWLRDMLAKRNAAP